MTASVETLASTAQSLEARAESTAAGGKRWGELALKGVLALELVRGALFAAVLLLIGGGALALGERIGTAAALATVGAGIILVYAASVALAIMKLRRGRRS